MSEIIQMLNPYFRIILINATCMIVGYHIQHLATGSRGPKWPGVVYVLYKVILVNTIMRFLLGPIYGGETWWRLSYSLLSFINIFLNIFAFKMMFKGSMLKILLIQHLTEIVITLESLAVNTLLNFVEGVSLDAIYSPMHPADLLAPLLLWGMHGLLCILAASKLKKLRGKEPKFRAVLWIMVIAYIGVSFVSVLKDNLGAEELVFFMGSVVVILVVGSIVLGVAIFRLHRRKVIAEHEYFRLSSSLLETYYGEIILQTQKIRQYQEILNSQMEELQRIDSQNLKNEKLNTYLHTLKAQYEEISVGIYCGDWLLDAFLGQLVKECREKKIAVKIHVQQPGIGLIDSRFILQVLSYLLVEVIDNIMQQPEEKRFLELQSDIVKNQYVLEILCGGTSLIDAKLKHIKKMLHEKNGILRFENAKEYQRIILLIPNKN